MDKAKALETAELQIDQLVKLCHRELNYWEILCIFISTCQKLIMLSGTEYYLDQNKN